MSELQERFELLLGLADEMGLVVRREPLDGEGGGLCYLKGQRVLFVDTLADPRTRYERTLEALSTLPEIEERFIRPDIREDFERIRLGR